MQLDVVGVVQFAIILTVQCTLDQDDDLNRNSPESLKL